VADAVAGQGIAEQVAFVGRAVVGHDPLDGDAEAFKPSQRPLQERGGTLLSLVGQDLGVGQPRGIIDGHVQRLPAGAALAALAGPVAGDAVADAVDAPELLRVEVEQLARFVARVADDGRLGIEGSEPAQAEPAQHEAHRREWQARLPGNGWPGQALAAQPGDLGDRGVIQARG
jgi:FtsZ-binding cell division protein ZapB